MIEKDTVVALLLDMFTFSPVPMCISTGGPRARYLQVNDAYLILLGYSWESLRDQEMVSAGAALSSPERERRMRLLDEFGSYRLEEATLRHANGRLIDCLISARRSTFDGESYDVEIIIDISEQTRLQRALDRIIGPSLPRAEPGA